MPSPEGAMPDRVEVHGLQVNVALHRFVADELVDGVSVTPDRFWAGFARLVDRFTARNREILEQRERLQLAIDGWHRDYGASTDRPDEYLEFLREIGYLAEEGPDFVVETAGVDDEIAEVAGPQLVVPVTNARYAINAANARWGSLYDALYGTDALGDAPPSGGYDPARGARVVSWARSFLDETFPLDTAGHSSATAYRVRDGALCVEQADGTSSSLTEPSQFVGFTGEPSGPTSLLLRHHGLGAEIVIDRDHLVGADDPAAVADVLLESAVTVIMDLEDSVAAVDAEDKVQAYRNWLGLMKGDLTAHVDKDGRSFIRDLVKDKVFTDPSGGSVTVRGRSLLLVRNVGHLMTTTAVLGPGGDAVPEGFLDAMITVAASLHDRSGPDGRGNSSTGAVYVVKPKMHGPEEVALTDQLFGHVEDVLGLEPNTVKIGVMDEERRTSANLKECLRAVRSRIAFINTGFLDRTGDEIHTSMEAGPMVRKAEMKSQPWISAYEDGNVDIGLLCQLPGRAQIGKGMWAAPDLMHDMLEEKIGHPRSGANCAWVPSPTAATLHAVHYHKVEVRDLQQHLRQRERASLKDLLTIPVADLQDLSNEDRVEELENNAQGILGYVVRWVDQGIGVSKVPDIHDIALMEDRATCRISSQHLANWLHHGITSEAEVLEVMRRMAEVVDRQNADDPNYRPMSANLDGPAFTAACALVLEGRSQPSGYTEPILHQHRAERKTSDRREVR